MLLNRNFQPVNYLIVIGILGFLSVNSINAPEATAASPETAVKGVMARLIPQYADHFLLEVIPQENGQDVFELESRDPKIVLRGNNGVSLCSALNWYLKYYCRAEISWCGVQLNLPQSLPPVEKKIHQVSPHKYRYFFNYCCFGYSLPWWDWPQWERMIDWMALNGINMPLSVTGQEAVWQKVLRDIGLQEASIRGFIAGPPYLPFGWMGCLDGWGGPLPQSWIDRHEELEKKILARERELGITPVLQGFTGHIPAAIREKYPNAQLQKIHWVDWDTYFLDPQDPLFQTFGKTFVEKQNELFGTDHLYAADTFIEMTPPSSDPAFLDRMGKAISGALTAADPQAIWVMQGWLFYNNAKFWQPPQAKAFLTSVPDERLMLLDLFCDVSPVWNITEAFYGKPWIWCVLLNFGNTIHLSGPLAKINQELHAAMQSPQRGKLTGIGIIQEGLGYNSVSFDLMTEMTWRKAPVELDRWIQDYAHRRYGKKITAAEKAWKILQDTVYSGSYSSPSVLCNRPNYQSENLPKEPVKISENHIRLAQAWDLLLQNAEELKAVDTYQYDAVNVGRQVLSDLTHLLSNRMVMAYQKNDISAFTSAWGDLKDLLLDLDQLLATRNEFLLGRCLEDAKRWGTNTEEKQLLEWNARNVITLWGAKETDLHDYARKEWSGLIQGFYLHRWEAFYNHLHQSLLDKKPFDGKALTNELQIWEEKWTHQNDIYADAARGNSVETAKKLYKKYSPKFFTK